jgi:opacity protein-like surface antigen
MKKYLLAFLILSALTITGKAQASSFESDCNQSWYISGLGGVHVLHYDTIHNFSNSLRPRTSPGLVLGGAVGYNFGSYYGFSYRLEGEIAYRYNDIKNGIFNGETIGLSGHISQVTYMANGYIDLNLNSPITPYVGYGMGYGKIKGNLRVTGFEGRAKSDGFVSQFIVGASTPVCEKVDLGLEYRYLLALKHANEHSVCVTVKRYF